MKLNLPQTHFSRLMRAIVEFNLIEENDHILIGLSGGKDSIFLTYALACMQKRLKKNFTLGAITINPMFTETFDTTRIAAFCQELSIPYYTHAVDIAQTIKDQDGKDLVLPVRFFAVVR